VQYRPQRGIHKHCPGLPRWRATHLGIPGCTVPGISIANAIGGHARDFNRAMGGRKVHMQNVPFPLPSSPRKYIKTRVRAPQRNKHLGSARCYPSLLRSKPVVLADTLERRHRFVRRWRVPAGEPSVGGEGPCACSSPNTGAFPFACMHVEAGSKSGGITPEPPAGTGRSPATYIVSSGGTTSNADTTQPERSQYKTRSKPCNTYPRGTFPVTLPRSTSVESYTPWNPGVHFADSLRAYRVLYTEWGPAGSAYTLVVPSWCPRPPRHDFQAAPEGLRKKWPPTPQ
jgi:hypothetical protein